MTTIETMLAQWRSLYGEWVVAELELREARQRRRGKQVIAMLEARVRQLQRECDCALDQTSAALATRQEQVEQLSAEAA
jgi:hypothetical protein